MQTIEVELLKLEVLLLRVEGVVDDVVVWEVLIVTLLIYEVVSLEECHLRSHVRGARGLEVEVGKLFVEDADCLAHTVF